MPEKQKSPREVVRNQAGQMNEEKGPSSDDRAGPGARARVSPGSKRKKGPAGEQHNDPGSNKGNQFDDDKNDMNRGGQGRTKAEQSD